LKNIKRLVAIGAMAIAVTGLTGCGSVDTGNSGVRITWDSQVKPNEEGAGFYTAIISSVEEWVGKEIMVELNDMTPKAGDNLTMAELDVEIYYTAAIQSHADLKMKYANAHVYEDGYWYPAYNLVKSQSRAAVYTAVSGLDSLLIHKNRDALAGAIMKQAQDILNVDDPGVFTITKVLIKKANTDPTLEKSIQIAIRKDKELEAAEKEEGIQKANARANIALTESLSPQIMRVKELDAMIAACQSNTCIIDFTNGNGATPLINIKR
jgi:hypothetical protein